MIHMQNFTEFIATFQHIDETQGYEASEQYINQNIQQIKESLTQTYLLNI